MAAFPPALLHPTSLAIGGQGRHSLPKVTKGRGPQRWRGHLSSSIGQPWIELHGPPERPIPEQRFPERGPP